MDTYILSALQYINNTYEDEQVRPWTRKIYGGQRHTFSTTNKYSHKDLQSGLHQALRNDPVRLLRRMEGIPEYVFVSVRARKRTVLITQVAHLEQPRRAAGHR